jgi:hypothetical protein
MRRLAFGKPPPPSAGLPASQLDANSGTSDRVRLEVRLSGVPRAIASAADHLRESIFDWLRLMLRVNPRGARAVAPASRPLNTPLI